MPRNQTGLGNRLIDHGPEMAVRLYCDDTDFCGVADQSSHLKHMLLTPIALALLAVMALWAGLAG